MPGAEKNSQKYDDSLSENYVWSRKKMIFFAGNPGETYISAFSGQRTYHTVRSLHPYLIWLLVESNSGHLETSTRAGHSVLSYEKLVISSSYDVLRRSTGFSVIAVKIGFMRNVVAIR